MKIKTYDKAINFLEKITKYYKEKRRKNLLKLLSQTRQISKVYFEEVTGSEED